MGIFDLARGMARRKSDCDFDHPHPEHPCGRRIIKGVTTCPYCGNLDGSMECKVAGCWEAITEADVDGLYLEAWGLAAPTDREGRPTDDE